jgi:hypothetical protein
MHKTIHYYALIARHYSLENRIAAENKRPLPNFVALQKLKRHRLLVKDKLEAYRSPVPIASHGLPATSTA